MDITDQYLAMNDGDPNEAAAQLALHLTRDNPATLKAGYSRPSAILTAIELFPGVEGETIVALNHRSGWGIEDLPRSAR